MILDNEIEIDLLQAIRQPLQDPSVYHTKGQEGLPGFGFRKGHKIVVAYRLYMPKQFFRDFSILATVRPDADEGGYVFAVVNPFDTIVHLGIELSPFGDRHTNISLVYTDYKRDTESKSIADFLVPRFTNEWRQFALKVEKNAVTLYFQCRKYRQLEVRRKPRQLVFDDASKLYIAQAGPIINREFEVRFHLLNNFKFI